MTEDLRIDAEPAPEPDAYDLAPGVRVPPERLEIRFSRASGPGGQNVNKTETRVQISLNVDEIDGFPPYAHRRLAELAGWKLTAGGVLTLASARFRDQTRNRQDCLDRLLELLRESLRRSKRRIPTRASRASKERRLKTKKGRSRIKQNRKFRGGDD